MKSWLAITRLLAIFAILGLVLAPFTAPAVAGGMAAPMAMADVVAMDMASMGDDMTMADMSCCPPEKPVMPDCQKACPLATLCLAKVVQGIAPVSAVPSRFSVARALLPGNDANMDTLAPIPPPRPPQA
ncbi:hypothetical protein [Microvirga arsenatis]|uniref:Uncharacterized protein n=1 Tax=Microvirga arsenatis TaxID=2692265 RepID=A0ABW9YY08_9HYPH|nr:hypothetical protein [Microvirga arsenatis]NBJ09436.1 hypothetical protein [Microvirga arsenatis]NBJ23706.1 hypothetical protein [Microvirga arsenatis]